MKAEMKGWKVLRSNGFSCGNEFCPHKIHYAVGRVMTPSLEGSSLFFFPDKKDAERFAYGQPSMVVVPCIAYNCRGIKTISADIYEIKAFWKLHRAKKSTRSLYTQTAPEGTWIAEKIKITA